MFSHSVSSFLHTNTMQNKTTQIGTYELSQPCTTGGRLNYCKQHGYFFQIFTKCHKCQKLRMPKILASKGRYDIDWLLSKIKVMRMSLLNDPTSDFKLSFLRLKSKVWVPLPKDYGETHVVRLLQKGDTFWPIWLDLSNFLGFDKSHKKASDLGCPSYMF